jgi:hypothetical protein
MKTRLASRLLASAGLALAAGMAWAQAPQPVFVPASQFSVAFDQSTREWQLLPLDGQDLRVSAAREACVTNARIPDGVWLVTHTAEGGVELLAPSVTALPPGHDGRVALLPCGETSTRPSLNAPASMVRWLAEHAGAVYVHE